MKTFFLLTVVAMLADVSSAAEPTQPLDGAFLRLYAETRGFMLGRPAKPKPTPDGKAVLFLRSGAKTPRMSLYEFDVVSGQTKELLTPESLLQGVAEELSAEEKARRERMRVSVGGFTDFQLSDDGATVLLSLSGRLYLLDRVAGITTALATGSGTLLDPKFSPDGTRVAYILDHDLFVYDLKTGKESPVTHGGTAVVTHGLAEFVAQEEMGRFSGFWWSPDSRSIAYEEANHEGVENWYVADPARPDRRPLQQFYPRPGKKNVAVRLGIIPITGGEIVWADWNVKEFEYLAAVRWDRLGPLTIQVQDRAQQKLLLLLVDPKTGRTTQLLEESDPAFLNLHQDVPQWLADDRGFLWIGEQENRSGLQWRNKDGAVKATIGQAQQDIHSLAGIDAKGETAIWRSYNVSPSSTVIYTAPITGEQKPKAMIISGANGINDVAVSRESKVYTLTRSTVTQLPVTHVLRFGREVDEQAGAPLPSVAIEPDFVPNIVIDEPDVGNYSTAVVRPRQFDPKKKYPVIMDVYGGPRHLSVVQAMRPWLLMQWLADQGFIVVAVDNRGTPGRGRHWERAIYQKFDSVPLQDQIAALKLLGARHAEMDLDRVGIVGWSFGGYMSALAVLGRPDIFKAAVAGAPVTDWGDYDTHYTERYLGVLPASQKAYDAANLLMLAPKLTRPLLLVHGTADDNVYFRHTLRLVDALFRAGKTFEVLPLSGLTHQVPDPVVTERLWTRIADHFHRYLGSPK